MLLGAALLLRFLVEMAMLAALIVAGAHVHWVLAIVFPIAAATLWGLFVAPKARIRVSEPVRFGVELALFAATTAGLVAIGAVALGIAFGVVAVVDAVAVRALDPPAAAA